MKKIIFSAIIAFGFSCSEKCPPLNVVTYTVIDTVRTEARSVIKDEYFEIKLSSVTPKSGEKYYLAKREIELVPNPFKMVDLYIVAYDNKPEKFKGSTELLNYMAARGYEMASERKNKYGGDYTFKKKP